MSEETETKGQGGIILPQILVFCQDTPLEQSKGSGGCGGSSPA